MTDVTEDKRDARRAIEDLELERRLGEAGAAAAKIAQDAVGLVGTFAADHREQAHGFLDRAESEVARVTGGTGAGFLGRVRSGLAAGVDLVADQKPGGQEPGGDQPPASPPSPDA
ncbi:hypothetical protein [Janibacter terrae]|uniref:hypothetical protein n=1 Tax=Janibacter terrae TaxID=103817 RepID=UPI0031F87D28